MKVKKVLVIGSGPIIIGQAAEFDYSGSQALQVLRDYGIKTVLINPNPATIMTDKEMVDCVYLEPLELDIIKKIIVKEKPDGILSAFGGQVALNLSKELAESGFLARENVKLLGSSLNAIKMAEDRFLFREKMISMGVPTPPSKIVSNIEAAIQYANEQEYPLIIRPAYTLGGSGGGIAYNENELEKILSRGLLLSSIGQCLVEKSIKGLKEIEFEVMRDANNNCVSVCHMENIDPVGIHTGESIVVSPIQSLTDREIQKLRSLSFEIVRSLDIVGACNVQLAHDSHTNQSYVIEVNPRVSRSSALASKATGYPIAKIAAHIALDKSLDEIINPITKNTYASFEPTLDYVIVKIPRWPFDKFKAADRSLATQMKSTGEIMAIGRNFNEAFLKGLRSLELKEATHYYRSFANIDYSDLIKGLQHYTNDWFIELLELFRRGMSLEEAEAITAISPYFLYRLNSIVKLENQLSKATNLTIDLLIKAKENGMTNSAIAYFTMSNEEEIRAMVNKHNIKPKVKTVDSCAAEFEASTPYYYQTYENESDLKISINPKKVVILGSGPIRIGQGIEFDYSCVHSLIRAKENGYETIMINNNPETCSTDFSQSDRLYFEPLYHEDVLNILDREKPMGIIVQFGGQTALNLTEQIADNGYKILGTTVENLYKAEDRNQFENLLDKLNIRRPKALVINKGDDRYLDKISNIKYPVIARPSFVLGGARMEIIYNEEELLHYLKKNSDVLEDNSILVDEYIKGKEIEVDALCDGTDVFIPGIMEHIERSGIHSGDSISVYPPQNLYPKVIDQVVNATIKLALALEIKGIINIQFTYKKGILYVLEVNPRASRTVPFLSKMTKIPMAKIATDLILGQRLKQLGYNTGLAKKPKLKCVKVPVFSFDKLIDAEPALGPEMKSTGEVLGVDKTFEMALYKGLKSSGIDLPSYGRILMTISDRYKKEALKIAKKFTEFGFEIVATKGTAEYFTKHSKLEVPVVNKISEGGTTTEYLIKNKKVDMIINTLSKGQESNNDGFLMRRAALENNIPIFTSLDTVVAVLKVYKLRSINVIGFK